MRELENETLCEVDCEFGGLTLYNIENLMNDYCFMSLTSFSEAVEKEQLIDHDGHGEFIYIDKDGIMYTKKDSYIRPSDLKTIFLELLQEEECFSYIDVARAIREKYSDGDYKVFAIFWYNRKNIIKKKKR